MAPRPRVPWHSKFNLPALLHHASQLRNVPCTCDLTQEPQRGSLNWTILLSFEDGVEWIFRSPADGDDDISAEVAGELLDSEVATMKYIKENSSIPVPEIFDYSSTKLNAIEMPYILMGKAPGTQLQDFRWDPHPPENRIFRQRQHISQIQKEKVMRQLGGVASQLLNLRFDKLGSLFEEAGEYRVGKCLSPSFIFHDRETLGDDIERGPFEDDDEYYQALISVFLRHAQELRIQHNVFFAPIPILDDFETSQSMRNAVTRWNDFIKIGHKIDNGQNRLDYCTVGHFLQQMIPFLRGETFGALTKPVDGFPLCHPDLSASNIFVDSDLNITCIIDLAFASTVPVSTSLVTPGLPHPGDGTEPNLDLAFKSGFIADRLLDESKLEFSHWECTRRAWLFTRLVLLDGIQDYNYFKELYTSVYKPTEEVNIYALFKTAQKEDKLVELAEEVADQEEWAPEILQYEEDYFAVIGEMEKPIGGAEEIRLIGIERRAIARKITMVSGLSQNFVADHRLWRWIEEMKRD
ncbi:hypothetical protein V494_04712 [Pseudogymnoascus sp. VKM F-4513 (FW-928)]|nr:hypothetical protein V494_04712 [Pseudogymnoascus sp. VKM F-4513 (FW-928)]